MPELPEVETIRQGLAKRLIGREIDLIKVLNPKSFIGSVGRVRHRKIIALKRRAKVLCLCLDNNSGLLFHLKMTGQLIYRPPSRWTGSTQKTSFAGGHPSKDWVAKLPNAYTRIIFTLNDNSRLFFNDLRLFGWCKVLEVSRIEGIFAAEFGPEPFSDQFTVEYLISAASKIPNRKIKQFITDQKIIAGVGNIYADEALFYACVSPLRKVCEITAGEWQAIRLGVVKALELGLKYGGSSIDTYVNVLGETGTAHQHLKVYRRTGELCPNNCGGQIKRIVLGGRSTHYCPICQR